MTNRWCDSIFQRSSLTAAVLALAMAVPAFPQSKSSGADDGTSVDFGIFAGEQWFRSRGVHRLGDGMMFGGRADENFTDYFGLEESFTVGLNDLKLLPYQENSYLNFEAHNYQIAINPIIYFTPRDEKFRPFVVVGPTYVWFNPADETGLKEKNSIGLIYGAGFKYWMTDRVGLRIDARGLLTRTPHFELPDFGANPGDLYIPRGGKEWGIQVTAGLDFGRRHHEAPPPPAPAPPPPPAPAPVNITVGGIEGAHDVCPGEDERLNVTASGWPADKTATYQWMVDGQPVEGATGTTFSLPTAGASGTKSVSVKVTAGDASATSTPVTVTIKDYHAPTVQFSVSPTTIPLGAKAELNATASGSDCGGAVSVAYAASEGSISGNTYDSTGVQFDMSNRSKSQTKVVHLTATATDAKGGTGSATADLNVTLNPEARRLDDLVFPPNSARVNNCGKRLLLEELTPMLRDDPNATVILIGHRDTSEKGKAATRLDEMRAINSAAVLSAGTGICPQLELSRVKVNWVGTDQSSTPRPSLCGESTNVKEKAGQAVKADDTRAQFRRVEVWFVPGGAQMPAGLTGLKDAPAAAIKAKGCPK